MYFINKCLMKWMNHFTYYRITVRNVFTKVWNVWFFFLQFVLLGDKFLWVANSIIMGIMLKCESYHRFGSVLYFDESINFGKLLVFRILIDEKIRSRVAQINLFVGHCVKLINFTNVFIMNLIPLGYLNSNSSTFYNLVGKNQFSFSSFAYRGWVHYKITIYPRSMHRKSFI